MSQFTAQELEEFEFRQRAEQELAASKQTESAPPSPDAATEAVNQVMMGGAGAAVGAAAGPVINAGAKQAQRTSIAKQMGVNPADLEWDSAGQKWARKTGFGAGEGKTVQEVNEEFKRIQAEKNKPVGRGKIASKMTGPYNVEKAAELADAETARQARFAAQRQAEMDALKNQQTAAKAPRGFKSALTAPMGMLGRGAVGLGAGLQGSDALNRYNAGDTSGSIISGIGALGTAAAMIPHPVTRIGGTAIGLGAEGLNTFLDYLKKKSQNPAQAQPQQPQQMAEGGTARKKMSKAERAAKAIRENNKKKVPHLAKGGDLPPAENAARTQIIGTLPTYEKAEEELKKRGAQGKALDFGAGLGEGAKILKADTYEPFPKGWKPTFIDPKQIPTEAYGKLTNLNVMNVVPPKVRDEIASHIGRVIEPGGQGIVTTRGADVMKAKGRPGPEPMSIITSRDTYQKGFTKQELEDYMKRMLGEKYDVNKVNLGPAGVHVQKKKPTIYTGGGIAIPVNAPVGSRAQETTGQGAAQILNPLNLNFKEGGSTTPAWQRSEGKSPSGGLNALGRASYKRETGGTLKAPQPEGGSRKKSFCARMGGMKKKLTSSKTANDPDSRINKALRKWKC